MVTKLKKLKKVKKMLAIVFSICYNTFVVT